MGLGILDDKAMRHVPGTEILNDNGSATSDTVYHPHLKRSKDGIILVPQPSDDPNDPLNWPLWRRDMITAILCTAGVFACTLSPLLAASSVQFFSVFHDVSIQDIAMLTGWHLLGVGIGGYVFVASARIWGKRHLFLLGLLIIVVSCIWNGLAGSNYKSFVAARFFQGVGLAPFEALLNAAVGELYFVHESGLRMAVSNMSLFGASFLCPVIAGNVTAILGWEWPFFLIAILVGVCFPAVFFLCPETAYRRDSNNMVDTSSCCTPVTPVSPPSYEAKEGRGSVEKIESAKTFNAELGTTALGATSRATCHGIVSRHSLRIFTGRKTDENFLKVFIRPLPLYLHPTVLWSCIIQGSIIGWTTLLGVMLATLCLRLGFNEVGSGNMYGGATVGAFIGFIFCALLTDSVAKWMTTLNKGVFEPEFRLVLILPLLVFSAGGLYGFGITASDAKYGWLLPDVFFGWLCGGLVFGTVVPAQYVVDAYRDLAIEAFTCMLLFKNIMCWLLCYEGFTWLAHTGSQRLFIIIATVEVGICLLTIPLYVFGKRLRSFIARHDYLKAIGLR